MIKDFKKVFIKKCLLEYFQRVETQMGEAIVRSKVNKTGALKSSLNSNVNDAGTGELMFHEYGRMLDMGVGRGRGLGSLKKTKVALQASRREGYKQISAIKPKRIYSRVAYGNLNYLTSKLLYGLTDEVIEQLKRNLNATAPN